VTLIPLEAGLHGELLQAVYAAAPAYWALHELSGAPPGQAVHDLDEAAATPGRTLLGMLVRDEAGDAVMVGMADVRLHYPDEGVATVGMMMVAEPHRRQGVGSAAWALLEPWLREAAGMRTVQLAVEQFNAGAVRFFAHLGFSMTGAARVASAG
jgi:RimJ/RimL family protein N-acetyltransferase